jgi:hypothetical protein
MMPVYSQKKASGICLLKDKPPEAPFSIFGYMVSPAKGGDKGLSLS